MEHVSSVHARLKKAARIARVRTGDDRRALLFELIAEHEKRLSAALEKAGPAGNEAVMKTWLQYPQDETLDALVRDLPDDPSPDIPLDDVIDQVLEAETKLTRAYELLAAHAGAPRLRSFFDSMAALEKDARRRYIYSELQAHDA